MTAFIPLLLALIVGGIIWIYPSWRRRRVLSRLFPQPWQAIVDRRLPFFGKMSDSEQQQLKQDILLFLDAKQFHGCGGLEINDDIRVTIAAHACLLLLNRRTAVYSRLHHILVYPGAFVARRGEYHDNGTLSDASNALLGESWDVGKVILSWNDVEKGAADFHDGHNVVLHEFSHQLDSESGSTNGAPVLRQNAYKTWAQVLSHEFEALITAIDHHHHTVMDYYGATNPAEFFAVATETFFEKPGQMAQRHPELYQELSNYYAVDPRLWQD